MQSLCTYIVVLVQIQCITYPRWFLLTSVFVWSALLLIPMIICRIYTCLLQNPLENSANAKRIPRKLAQAKTGLNGVHRLNWNARSPQRIEMILNSNQSPIEFDSKTSPKRPRTNSIWDATRYLNEFQLSILFEDHDRFDNNISALFTGCPSQSKHWKSISTLKRCLYWKGYWISDIHTFRH